MQLAEIATAITFSAKVSRKVQVFFLVVNMVSKMTCLSLFRFQFHFPVSVSIAMLMSVSRCANTLYQWNVDVGHFAAVHQSPCVGRKRAVKKKHSGCELRELLHDILKAGRSRENCCPSSSYLRHGVYSSQRMQQCRGTEHGNTDSEVTHQDEL